MSNLFVVDISHECDNKPRGRYERLQTIYHLHNEFQNHRCELVEGQYRCLGCKQTFSLEEVKNSLRRDIKKTKEYWLELIPTGQHLPVDSQDSYWYHVHPDDDLAKRKEAKVSMNIDATCPVCHKKLNLHSWKEPADNQKTMVFAGIVVEIMQVSTWVEIEIFRKKGIEIWLKDNLDKYFLLSASGQLLPAEKQGDTLYCGNEKFLGNDYLTSLLFIFDEELTQEMTDQHIDNGKGKKEDESFHLNISMIDDEMGIPQKPDTPRKDRSTKELSSGDLAAVQEEKSEREQSQEIIVIVDGEHAETHIIPRHYKVNLDEATPLPEDAHPLLIPDLAEKNVTDSRDGFAPMELAMTDEPKMVITIEQAEASGLLVLPNIANEPTMAITEALTAAVPTITNVTKSRDGVAPTELAMTDQSTTDVNPNEPAMTDQSTTDVNPAETPDPLKTANADIDENAMTAESGMLGNQLPDFTADEDNWFSTGEKEVDQKKLLKEHARTQAWLNKLGQAPAAVTRGRTLIGVPNTAVASKPPMSLTESPTAAVPTVTEDAPPELSMTEQPVTNVEHTDTAEAEAAPVPVTDDTLAKLEAAEAELETANAVIDQLLGQSRPVSGTIETGTDVDVANEPTMALGEAPTAAVSTITNVTDSRDGFAPSELAMTDEPRTNVENTDDGAGEPTPASHHGVSRLCWECQRSLPADQACSEHEVSCPDCGLANSKKESTCRRCQHVFCPPEPAMTESANTGTTDAPSPEPIPASGGCGSAFTKKTKKLAATTPHPELKNVLTKIGLAVGMVGILVFVPMLFSWLINYFQSEDLKAELRAAEKRRMELSSQTNKLRVEADLIRFDLLESRRDLGQVRNDISTVQTEQQRLAERQSELDNRLSNALSWEADLHAYFVKEKNLFGQYLAELAKNLRDEQKAWQRQERERNEQRYAELVKQLKSLATTQPRETPVVAPPKSLFGGKPEQEKPEMTVLVEPAKSFLDELMPALIELNKQLAKKYRDHKKAPPTLVVDKTPVTPPPQKPTQNPPAVDKSAKDKTTAPVDKSKNPQKSAEKITKIDINTIARSYEQ